MQHHFSSSLFPSTERPLLPLSFFPSFLAASVGLTEHHDMVDGRNLVAEKRGRGEERA